ncbi:hypothetical protein [Streptomyces sp. PU-14G]|uniref:hypothetical protein n=1 Tax=Streptomyces sp. PU-14G TaxID=2800808 RepID=UPI0034DEBB22
MGKDSDDRKKKKGKEREELPVMPGGFPPSVASSSGRSSRRESVATTSSRSSGRSRRDPEPTTSSRRSGGGSRRDSAATTSSHSSRGSRRDPEPTTSSRSNRSHRSRGETSDRRGSPSSDGSGSSGSSGTDVPALDEAVDRLSQLPSSPASTASSGSADDLPSTLRDAPQEMPWYHSATRTWHYLRGSQAYTSNFDERAREWRWFPDSATQLASGIRRWGRENAVTIGTDIGGAAFAGQGIGILGNPPSAPANTWGSRMYGLGGVTVNSLVPLTQLATTPNATYAHYGLAALNAAGQAAYGIGASGLIQTPRWAWATQGAGALTAAGATWAYNHLPQRQQQQEQGNILPLYNMPEARQAQSDLALAAHQSQPSHPAYGRSSTLAYRPGPPTNNPSAASVNAYQPQVSYRPSGRGRAAAGEEGYQTSAQTSQPGVQRRSSHVPGGGSYSQQSYSVNYSQWQNPYGGQSRSPSPAPKGRRG